MWSRINLLISKQPSWAYYAISGDTGIRIRREGVEMIVFSTSTSDDCLDPQVWEGVKLEVKPRHQQVQTRCFQMASWVLLIGTPWHIHSWNFKHNWKPMGILSMFTSDLCKESLKIIFRRIIKKAQTSANFTLTDDMTCGLVLILASWRSKRSCGRQPVGNFCAETDSNVLAGRRVTIKTRSRKRERNRERER